MMSQDGLSSVPLTVVRGLAQPPNSNPNHNPNTTPVVMKKKRNLPGKPDPDAEVIAMSPKSLMATNRFLCEICNKGFKRDQNLQLHRRGHNLPWKLKQRSNKELVIRKKVYICPEKTCVHHNPSRALGDLTGIKKHFSRKHGEKKWKCEKCSKKYAVKSDWKAHGKICGTREYRCDCGTLFSRKDSFITHRAFCDTLAESGRFTSVSSTTLNQAAGFRNIDLINGANNNNVQYSTGIMHPFSSGLISRPEFGGSDSELVDNLNINIANLQKPRLQLWLDQQTANSQLLNPIGNIPCSNNANAFLAPKSSSSLSDHHLGIPPINMFGSLSQTQWLKEELDLSESVTSLCDDQNSTLQQSHSPHMSATALLQKAAQMGFTRSNNPTIFNNSGGSGGGFGLMSSSPISTISSSNTYDLQNENEAYKLFKQANHQSDNINELVSSLSSSTQRGAIMKDGLNTSSNYAVEASLTRDFLGVGGESSSPFIQQLELPKFASMGSVQPWS